MQLLPWVVLGSLLASVSAAPHNIIARAGGTCTITQFSQLNQIKSCSNIVLQDLYVPAGQTLTLDLPKGAHLQFAGKTHFGYQEWEGPLISMSGDSVTVTAAKGAVIDGNGPRWWDGKGGKGKTKPKFFRMQYMTNSHVTGLYIKNTPVQAMSLTNNQQLYLDHIFIDNRAGDTLGGHNTDGFDVSNSNGVHITNPTVYNQDDCLAINGGSSTYFSGALCSGGHGISIGSVSSGKAVSGVFVDNSRIVNSVNGVRIKTVEGATGGSVHGVSYTNIHLDNISGYGMMIEQDYSKKTGGPSGHPTAGIPIYGVTIKDVTGTVGPKGSPINVVCAKGGCYDWTVSHFDVTGGQHSQKCQNVPAGIKC